MAIERKTPRAVRIEITPTPEEYRADPYLWYNVVHEEDRPVVLRRAAQLLAGERVPPLEHRIYHKGGAVRWSIWFTVFCSDSIWVGLFSGEDARAASAMAIIFHLPYENGLFPFRWLGRLVPAVPRSDLKLRVCSKL